MATSPALSARRALVKLLLHIASLYRVVLGVSRDSSDKDVNKGLKKLLLTVHPDKGGSEEHTKKLKAAKDEWDKENPRQTDDPTGGRAEVRSATGAPAGCARFPPEEGRGVW
jgi:curved DNA-binding protein CbpA